MNFLEKQAEFKTYKPSMLISIEKNRMLSINKEGQIRNILFEDLSSSIRPRIDENRKDKKLTDFTEFFESGDLIWLSEEENLISISVHPKVQSALVSMNPITG